MNNSDHLFLIDTSAWVLTLPPGAPQIDRYRSFRSPHPGSLPRGEEESTSVCEQIGRGPDYHELDKAEGKANSPKATASASLRRRAR